MTQQRPKVLILHQYCYCGQTITSQLVSWQHNYHSRDRVWGVYNSLQDIYTVVLTRKCLDSHINLCLFNVHYNAKATTLIIKSRLAIWSQVKVITVPSLTVLRLHPNLSFHPRHSAPDWEQQRCFHPRGNNKCFTHCGRVKSQDSWSCSMTNLIPLVSFPWGNICWQQNPSPIINTDCDRHPLWNTDTSYQARFHRQHLVLRAFPAPASHPHHHHRHHLRLHLFLSVGLSSFYGAKKKEGKFQTDNWEEDKFWLVTWNHNHSLSSLFELLFPHFISCLYVF